MNELLETVGERIRSVRTARGLSQQKLAEIAGISYKYLGEIERGQVNVSLEILWKVAEALEVDVCTLLIDLCDGSKSANHTRAMMMIEDMSTSEAALACDLLEAVRKQNLES